MNPNDVTIVENSQGGFTARQCLATQSRIYGQLRKRYAVDTLGQSMGPPSGAGLSPPPLAFRGVPVSGDLEIVLTFTSGGTTGIAAFTWSPDGGATVLGPVLTASLVPLGGTGVSVVCPPVSLSFQGDEVYTAATPVPEVMLRWIVDTTTPRIFERRGVNPTNDSQYTKMGERDALALAEVERASNAVTGLFDLPLNVDTGGSGVSAPQPIGGGQASPFAWMDVQRARGRREDRFCR